MNNKTIFTESDKKDFLATLDIIVDLIEVSKNGHKIRIRSMEDTTGDNDYGFYISAPTFGYEVPITCVSFDDVEEYFYDEDYAQLMEFGKFDIWTDLVVRISTFLNFTDVVSYETTDTTLSIKASDGDELVYFSYDLMDVETWN
jgi:hypothetical protein